jgi:hypothetical protein
MITILVLLIILLLVVVVGMSYSTPSKCPQEGGHGWDHLLENLPWHHTPVAGIDYVERWVGFHLRSDGALSVDIWEHNPGTLAHVYLFRFPVPEEVQDHFLARRPCLVIDKYGKPKGNCHAAFVPPPTTTTGEPE